MKNKIYYINSLSNEFYSIANRRKNAAGISFICIDDGSIFLCLRSERCTFQNTWSIPGGKIEDGENEIDAAIREIIEELGSSPNPSECNVLDAIIFDSHHLNYTTFVISISLKEKENWKPVLNQEHIDCKWFPLNNLPDNLHPGAAKTIPIIIKNLQEPFQSNK